jgi:hypothetical protein
MMSGMIHTLRIPSKRHTMYNTTMDSYIGRRLACEKYTRVRLSLRLKPPCRRHAPLDHFMDSVPSLASQSSGNIWL